MKHDFNQRREKRIATAKHRAVKNEQEAESLYHSAREMASAIPFGQPILVGHHSEKRDRNYRDKIHNTFGRSFEKREKAAYYAHKAEAIQHNDTIFSDDPKALEKLNKKLESLQESREFMKLTNRYIKKKDLDSFLKMPHATLEVWDQLNAPDVMGEIGFPSYSLRNTNANIRQVKQRIEQLERQEVRPPVDKVVNGVRIYENREAGRLQLIFEGRPSQEVRKLLKQNGFKWSPTEGAWQRHINNWAYRVAVEIAESLNKSAPS